MWTSVSFVCTCRSHPSKDPLFHQWSRAVAKSKFGDGGLIVQEVVDVIVIAMVVVKIVPVLAVEVASVVALVGQTMAI